MQALWWLLSPSSQHPVSNKLSVPETKPREKKGGPNHRIPAARQLVKSAGPSAHRLELGPSLRRRLHVLAASSRSQSEPTTAVGLTGPQRTCRSACQRRLYPGAVRHATDGPGSTQYQVVGNIPQPVPVSREKWWGEPGQEPRLTQVQRELGGDSGEFRSFALMIDLFVPSRKTLTACKPHISFPRCCTRGEVGRGLLQLRTGLSPP